MCIICFTKLLTIPWNTEKKYFWQIACCSGMDVAGKDWRCWLKFWLNFLEDNKLQFALNACQSSLTSYINLGKSVMLPESQFVCSLLCSFIHSFTSWVYTKFQAESEGLRKALHFVSFFFCQMPMMLLPWAPKYLSCADILWSWKHDTELVITLLKIVAYKKSLPLVQNILSPQMYPFKKSLPIPRYVGRPHFY